MLSFLLRFVVVVMLIFSLFAGAIYYKAGKQPLYNLWEKINHDGIAVMLSMDTWKSMLRTLDAGESSSPGKAKVKIYKWVDAKGVVHYDNQPVASGKEIEIDANNNVISMAKPTQIEDVKPETKPKTMNEEMKDIQKVKEEYIDSVVNQ